MASLPDLPKGKEFEEYLAAYLQASGLYVERSIVDLQEKEVLELDIIATKYKQGTAPIPTLYEVKAGNWGFEDIFKIRGWLDYLNFSAGALIVMKETQPFDFYKKVAASLGISLVAVPNLAKTADYMAPCGVSAAIKAEDVLTWRFSYWAERQLLRWLKSKKKADTGHKCYESLERYAFHINSRLFFTKNVVQRAEELYAAFREFPHISAKMACELEGQDFNDDHHAIPKKSFDACYYGTSLHDLAISTYVEHRSRLAVMKSAIDYQLFKASGSDQNEKTTFVFGDKKFEIGLLDSLPASFKTGLATVSKHKYVHRYPVLWQWFLWFFGGFIWLEQEEKEYRLLSEKSGVPIDEINNALSAYDTLFPLSGGWFVKVETLRVMKLMPTPFMGIGANYRRLIYVDKQDFDGLKVSGMYAKNNLIRFNNHVVELLEWNS